MEHEALALPSPTPGGTILTLPTDPLNLIKKDNKKQSYHLSKQTDGKGLRTSTSSHSFWHKCCL